GLKLSREGLQFLIDAIDQQGEECVRESGHVRGHNRPRGSSDRFQRPHRRCRCSNRPLLCYGYDVTGYDVTGYDVTGYDVTGYDVTGYDVTATLLTVTTHWLAMHTAVQRKLRDGLKKAGPFTPESIYLDSVVDETLRLPQTSTSTAAKSSKEPSYMSPLMPFTT
ncbi:unnamed protein product, partial [Darwinula stevensoni]